MTTDAFFTDSHAHVDYDVYDADREEILRRADEAGVKRIVNIALGPEREKWEKAVGLFASRPDIPIAVGVHPHDVSRMTDETLKTLREFASRPGVVALGEIGLDYYYMHSPREMQLKRFDEMLDLAADLKLPVTIHSRDAFADTYAAVSSRRVLSMLGIVFHCFTGTVDEVRKCLDLGAYVGVGGIVTFKKAEALRDVVRFLPVERILIETDAPYLAPEPYRGKRNEPAYVVRVAEAIAAVKGLEVAEVGRITSENAGKVFKFRRP